MNEELKKKHSSRLVRGGAWQPGWRRCAARWQLEDWVGEAVADGPGGPTFTCG